jgi:hypothetical protein
MLPESGPRERWEKAGLDDLLHGLSPLEFTLRFTLSNPDLDTTIVGTRNVGRSHDNIDAALKGPLPESVVGRRSDASRRPVLAQLIQTDEDQKRDVKVWPDAGFSNPPMGQALFNGDGRTYRVPLFNNGRIMAMLC